MESLQNFTKKNLKALTTKNEMMFDTKQTLDSKTIQVYIDDAPYLKNASDLLSLELEGNTLIKTIVS